MFDTAGRPGPRKKSLATASKIESFFKKDLQILLLKLSVKFYHFHNLFLSYIYIICKVPVCDFSLPKMRIPVALCNVKNDICADMPMTLYLRNKQNLTTIGALSSYMLLSLSREDH